MREFDAESQSLLRQIASNTARQIAELGSIAYMTGLFLSLGMNLALDDGNILWCFFSWVNVGHILTNLLGG